MIAKPNRVQPNISLLPPSILASFARRSLSAGLPGPRSTAGGDQGIEAMWKRSDSYSYATGYRGLRGGIVGTSRDPCEGGCFLNQQIMLAKRGRLALNGRLLVLRSLSIYPAVEPSFTNLDLESSACQPMLMLKQDMTTQGQDVLHFPTRLVCVGALAGE